MSNSLTKLFTLNQFNKLHHDKNMSIYQIAEHYETYPNKVRRLAKKLGAKVRNKSEAQKVALQTGRQEHPTEGKLRDEAVKVKISESIANQWDNMSKKEKTRRSKMAKKQWDNMSVEEKRNLQIKASEGVRHAAKHGSKLEVAMLEWLVEHGYQVTFHKQHLIGNERMHLDLLIKDKAIVIEIDGPSHFEPIWGRDKLIKSQTADTKKDGILLNAGFCVIRVRQKKDLTKKLTRDILLELEKVLKRIENKNNPRRGTRRFVIGE